MRFLYSIHFHIRLESKGALDGQSGIQTIKGIKRAT